MNDVGSIHVFYRLILHKIKTSNKNKKGQKTINDILKIFFKSIFVLNSKFK